jgi:hypothetical protein
VTFGFSRWTMIASGMALLSLVEGVTIARGQTVAQRAMPAVTLSESPSAAPNPAPTAADSDRYGPFDLFDHRSRYNTNWFPEPLLADEMDADQELRLNYLHTEKRNIQGDEVSGEIEKTWGLFTVEVEVPYSHASETADGVTDNIDGIGSIEVAARHPFYQYVSADGGFDLTLGARVEVAIPSGSEISKNTEVVGGLYETLALGEHLTLQASAAYATLFGPGEDSGEQVLEYAGVLGYNIDVNGALALSRVTPVFEVDGQTALNHADSGTTALTGAAGANLTFQSISWAQPKILLGYVFPLNDAARQDFDWGITTSLVLEY